jgi:membrane protease YdiL (CAAX protease family)
VPREVREFVRAEWRALLVVIVAAAAIAAAIYLRNADLPWPVRAGMLGVAALVFAGLAWQPKYRAWARQLTVEQWRAIDRETVPPPSGTYRWQILVVLVTVAVSLTLQEYIGDRGFFEEHFKPSGPQDQYYALRGFAWWSGWRVTGYVILPLVTLALMRERIRDYHLSPRGFFKHLWVYVVLFCLVLPAVLAASRTGSFRHTYPFYRLANRSYFDLWAWEGLYAAQFVALEIFFRGFILHALRRVCGSNAIFVMIVPYCMIHYGKPMPETFGAIGAGIILGTLAMRTRSIWGGVLIHIGVATTMDMLALHGCPPIGSNIGCTD